VGFATALFNCAVTLGAGLAMFAGGNIAQASRGVNLTLPIVGLLRGWQAAFIAVGLPGLLFALLILLVVDEPARKRLGIIRQPMRIGEVLGYFGQDAKTFSAVFLGLGGSTMSSYALTLWGPTFLMRTHGMFPSEVGTIWGMIWAIVGTAGILTGGIWSDRMTLGGVAEAPIRVARTGALIAVIFLVAAFLIDSKSGALILLGVGAFGSYLVTGIQGATINLLVPNRMRGQTSALYIATVTFLGLAIAPLITATMTEHLFQSPADIGKSLAITCGIAGLMSTAFLTRAIPLVAARASLLRDI
jgi:MFS family permease